MKKVLLNSFLFVLVLSCNFSGKEPARLSISLDKTWLFHHGDLDWAVGNEEIDNLDEWQVVEVPHDWAISGNFDKNNDPQSFVVIEDGEEIPTTRYGRIGGLPHMGVGWYRKSLDIPLSLSNKQIHIEFAWTRFDNLGEPTPYNIEWPARSLYFGKIDLCGIPKDRYYLYQSKWSSKEVLHLLPHWNWEGNEGEAIPVHCYANFKKAELFLNGRSFGVQQKDFSQLYRKYCLVWDVPYQPGELKVVALSPNDQPVKESKVHTAGKPYLIKLETDQTSISADGKELVFVTVSVVDERGIFCLRASNQINIKVEGGGKLKAIGSGDPTSLEPFVRSTLKLFNGKCLAFV